MSELAGLEVKVTADLSGLVKEFNKANKTTADFKNQLARFQKALESATDPKTVNRLNKAIDVTASKIKSLESSSKNVGGGLNNLSNASNTAGQSLQNLSRIAQDAPFGFIGIANNINPLLESFQRLRKESGSTGGALKALAGSLAGGGGLGLAFGVVTAAITFASIGLQAWGGANKKSKEAVDENKKATEDFAKALRDVERDGIRTGLSLQGFVSIARDQTQSLATRNQALEQANKILGDHGDKLTLVNIATQAVTEQIDKFTKATIQQALATKFADRAADLFINQKDAAKAYGKELEKLKTIQAKTLTVENAQGVTILTDAGKEAAKQQRIVIALANEYKKVTGEVKGVVSELTAAQVAAASLFGSLDGDDKITGIIAKIRAEIKTLSDVQPTLISEQAIRENVSRIKVLEDELNRLLGKKRDSSNATKEVRKVSDVIGDLKRRIAELNREEFVLNTDNAQERVSAFLNAIKELAVKFKLDPKGDIIKDLFDKAKFAKLGFILEDGFAKLGVAASRSFRKAVTDDLEANPLKETVPIGFDILPLEKNILGKEIELPRVNLPSAARNEAEIFVLGQKFSKAFTDGLSQLNDADFLKAVDDLMKKLGEKQQLAAEMFSSIAEAAGKGFATSGKFLSNAFSSVLNLIGDYLVKLGKAAIVQSKIISAIKLANPLSGLAAGLAAVAAGMILKNIKLPGFANGVENFSGGLAMVGERGPELVRLPRGSDVIPNHELNGMTIGGGQAIMVTGQFRLEGTTLVAAVKRGNERLSRQL